MPVHLPVHWSVCLINHLSFVETDKERCTYSVQWLHISMLLFVLNMPGLHDLHPTIQQRQLNMPGLHPTIQQQQINMPGLHSLHPTIQKQQINMPGLHGWHPTIQQQQTNMAGLHSLHLTIQQALLCRTM